MLSEAPLKLPEAPLKCEKGAPRPEKWFKMRKLTIIDLMHVFRELKNEHEMAQKTDIAFFVKKIENRRVKMSENADK